MGPKIRFVLFVCILFIFIFLWVESRNPKQIVVYI